MLTAKTLQVNGQETFYYAAGDGEPVVLIHGMLANAECWEFTHNDLSRSHTVITPDLPGHGRSQAGLHPYGLEFYARWLHALVGILGIERFALVGHSMGGGIALHYALQHPEHLTRLALSNPLGVGGRLFPGTVRLLARRAGYAVLLSLTRKLDPYLFKYVEGEIVMDPTGEARGPLVAMAEATLQKGAWPLISGLRLKMVDFLVPGKHRAFAESLHAIALPVLVIWGTHDGLLPVDNVSAGSRYLPQARWHMLEGSAHMPMLDEPEAFNALLNDFMTDRETNQQERAVSG